MFRSRNSYVFVLMIIKRDYLLKCAFSIKRSSKIPKGQTEIVKSRTDKTMASKMKRKTNIEHTTLH